LCVAAAALRTGPELIRKLKEGINLDVVRTLAEHDNTLTLPTPMGVPLSLNVSTTMVLKLDGMVKAKSLPEPSDFLLRRPYLSRRIEIMTDITPG